MTRYVEAESAKADSGLALTTGRAMPNAARANPWDIWVEGKYASFRDTSGAGVEGKFALVTLGTDYVFSPTLLAGVMVQFDQTKQTSGAQQSSIEGNGWMVGPYGTVRLNENLFWQGRAAWGTSSNSVSPFLTYTDKFSSTRWLLASTFVGRWDRGPWSFRPAASISYIEGKSQSYADTFGITMPDVKNALGQAEVGPEISYKWRASDDLIVQPKAGAQLIWNFAGSSTANSIAIDGNAAGPQGVRGHGELGVGFVHDSGVTLDLSGSYDGIGASGYGATTGKAMVRVPLN